MKNAKLNRMLAATVIALLSLLIFEPGVMAYLSGSDQANISIRATPVAEVWNVEGSFNVDSWAGSSDGMTGIWVHNLTENRPLWIYVEYTGDLNQVFQARAPFKVEPNSTQPLALLPLDSADSPRMPNPRDLIDSVTCGEGCKCQWNVNWHTFRGSVIIHILNEYDSRLVEGIAISGETLWSMYFENKKSINVCDYYKSYWYMEWLGKDTSGCGRGPGPGGTVSEEAVALLNESLAYTPESNWTGEALDNGALASQSEAALQVENLLAYKPVEFVLPILQGVESIAPGLLQERAYFQEQLAALIAKVQELSALIDDYRAEVASLQAAICDLQAENQSLKDQVAALEAQNQALQQVQYTSAYAVEAAPSSPAPVVEIVVEPSGTASETGSPAEEASETSVDASVNTEEPAPEEGSPAAEETPAPASESPEQGEDSTATSSDANTASDDSSGQSPSESGTADGSTIQ